MTELGSERLTEQNPWQLVVGRQYSPAIDTVVSFLFSAQSNDFGSMSVHYNMPKGERIIEFPHDDKGLEQLHLLEYFYGRAQSEQLRIQGGDPNKNLGLYDEEALKQAVERIITQWGEHKEAGQTS